MNGAAHDRRPGVQDCIWGQERCSFGEQPKREGGSSSVNSDVTVASLTLTNIFALNGSGSVTVTDLGACSAVSSMAIEFKAGCCPGCDVRYCRKYLCYGERDSEK